MKSKSFIQPEYRPLAIAFCLALFFIGTIYLLLQAASGYDGVSYVEPDQTLYMQYARNMATGHPYVFTLGDAPSTGSTSYFYPWILAGLYKLGAHGNAFFAAVFWLNAFFYLGIIFFVWLIAKKMTPKLAPFATFLTVLSGQTLTTLFGGTDMGLFCFLTLGLFSALLYEKKSIAIVLTFLCGLTRPEGFIIAVAGLFIGGYLLFSNHKKAKKAADEVVFNPFLFLFVGIAALFSFLITLFINYYLTGYFQFMSVMNKGHFMQYSFSGAIVRTFHDFLALVKGVIFGLTDNGRQFLGIPVLSGLLGILGILLFVRSKKIALREWWFLLVTGGVFLTISMSGWQGISNDRYLGWFFPIWGIYILIGIQKLAQQIRSSFLFYGLLTLVFGFQFISSGIALDYVYSSGVYTYQIQQFGKMLDRVPPEKSRIGVGKGSGIQYFMPHQLVMNITGILTPDFFIPHVYVSSSVPLLEHLKHHSQQRFDYWLLRKDEFSLLTAPMPSSLGKLITSSTDASLTLSENIELHEAHWEALDGGALPQLFSPPKEKTLMDQIDVGYRADEQMHDYSYQLRIPNLKIPLISKAAPLGKKKEYFEAGYLVAGFDSFQIHHIQPQKPMLIILRTTRTAKVHSILSVQQNFIDYEMKEKIRLLISVDGDQPSSHIVKLEKKGFSEVAFLISADRIKSKDPHIRIYGDHIAFAYWFYQ